MKKINSWLRNAFLIALLSFLTQSLFAQKQVLKEVPKELYGFWQFKVANKGDWNGITLGRNYIEHFYSLSQVDSVVQNGNSYTLHLTAANRRDGKAIIKISDKGQAKMTFEFEYQAPKEYNCKHFASDPDIELLPESKYSEALDGAWIMGKDIRKPLSIKQDKLQWNAEEWKIIWLGEYLKKEYRALIEKDGHYRLIYITPQKDKSKKLVFGNNVQYYHPMPAKSEQNMLYGTWCDRKSNEWLIGFFDKIAIYKNKTWQYKILKQKKNKYKVELSKGKESVLLDLKLKGKALDICKFSDGKRKLKLHYTPRPLPYHYPDNKPFKKRPYKLDSVTISGYLLNYPEKNKPFEVSVYDITEGEYKNFYADINENGSFTMKIPVINTSQIHLDWRTSYLTDVVEPNEDYFIFIDYAGSKNLWSENNAVIWHMGKNTRLHQEIINHKHKTKISHYLYRYQNKSKTAEELLELNKIVYQKKIDELKHYIKANPIQSEKLKSFAYNSITTELGLGLMQNRFLLDSRIEHFSKKYETYVDSLMQSIDIPYTLTACMSGFIRDYVRYNFDKSSTEKRWKISNKELAEFIEEAKLYHFTEEEKKLIDKSEKIAAEIDSLVAKKDTLLIKERVEFYKKDLEAINKIFNKPETENAFFHCFHWREIKYLSKQFNLLPVKMSDEVKDLVFLRKGLEALYHQQIPLLPCHIDFLMKNIKNEYFKKLLKERQESFINLEKRNIDYLNTLKRTDHLKDSKTADELIKKLIEPYKGKVIYLDVWGTWCGPCKREMKYVSAIKRAMKGKDVIFMYLANRSPERSWKNVIKQNHLVGDNIVHYNLPEEQEAMLERRLGIRSFPTFMIIDKKGQFVNMKAPRPSEASRLIQELNKWLK